MKMQAGTMWQEELCSLLLEASLGDHQAWIAALELKNSNIPRFLYKYQPYNEFTAKNLISGKIWASSPMSFNDPMDCLASISISDLGNSVHMPYIKVGRFTKIDTRHASRMLRIELMKRMIENHHRTIKVCCFSEIADSTLLWSHYADQHRGFRITYDTRLLSRAQLDAVFPVIYTNDLDELTHDTREVKNWNAHLILSALIKMKSWQHEQEWRFIEIDSSHPKGRDIDFIDVNSIALGVKMTNTDASLLKRICIIKRVFIYLSYMDFATFSLDRRELLLKDAIRDFELSDIDPFNIHDDVTLPNHIKSLLKSYLLNKYRNLAFGPNANLTRLPSPDWYEPQQLRRE